MRSQEGEHPTLGQQVPGHGLNIEQLTLRIRPTLHPDIVPASRDQHPATRRDLFSSLLELVHLRASQINGCGACVDMGARAATKAGETPERLWSLVAWREAPYYTDAERAALALTEAATRMADHPESVTDAIWDEAADHYDEQGLSAIILMVALTNFFNRINVPVREPAGTTW
jgi:AhpD family alkylhydroperoxidase